MFIISQITTLTIWSTTHDLLIWHCLSKLNKTSNESDLDGEDGEDEDNVYPFGKKYDESKDRSLIAIKFILLIITLTLILLFVLSSLLTVTQTLSVRLGYFADKITSEEFILADFSEIAVNTKNCITYLLESNGASDKVEIYASADRSSSIDISIDGSTLNVKVAAEVSTVQ
jgi:hypothetical protein